MATVTIHTAKTTLSQLIARVEAGEEIILARGNQPVARLIAIVRPSSKRQFGAYRGRAAITDAFFDPLSDDELSRWGQ